MTILFKKEFNHKECGEVGKMVDRWKKKKTPPKQIEKEKQEWLKRVFKKYEKI